MVILVREVSNKMLSVVIIAKNEAEMLRACIESVKWADEIIVIDDDSSDQTASVARKNGARVVDYSRYARDENIDGDFLGLMPDFAELRGIGLKEAKGDWLLYIDADERVLKPLREEIEGKMQSQDIKVAWAISRRNIILGEEKRYRAFWPDYVIRLFKKEHLEGWQGRVHEQPEFRGELGYLKNFLLHLTHRDIDLMVLKSLDWANIDADLRLKANHPKMTGPRFIKIIFSEIWNQGIKRQGFFNGTVGTIDSLLQVFSVYLSYVKLWQLQRNKSLKQIYQDIDKRLIKDGFKYEDRDL